MRLEVLREGFLGPELLPADGAAVGLRAVHRLPVVGKGSFVRRSEFARAAAEGPVRDVSTDRGAIPTRSPDICGRTCLCAGCHWLCTMSLLLVHVAIQVRLQRFT